MKIAKVLIVMFLSLVVASFAFSGKRTNPPVENQVAWDGPETETLFRRACADCHSNETKWPWYSRFAPLSWKLIDHVEHGRRDFNVSEIDMGHADGAAELVEDGDMPLNDYLRMHREAKLTDEEKVAFIAGLKRTFGEGQ